MMSGAQTGAMTVGTVGANSIRAFLFDLDGTLVDSVPDLTTAVNQLRSVWRFEPVSEEQVRWSSLGCAGARGSALERA